MKFEATLILRVIIEIFLKIWAFFLQKLGYFLENLGFFPNFIFLAYDVTVDPL